MPTVQEMVAKKVAENKAESLAKKSVVSPVASAPVNQVTSTDATKTQGTNNITFWSPTKTPVPVSTPTSLTQWATTPTPVAQKTPVTAPTAPKVIWEENWQPIYERQQVTTPWVTGTNLNLPTAKGSLDNPTYSFDVKDPNNYMGTGMTVEQFKTLPLETQSAYTNSALANEQQKVWLVKQVEYASDVTKQKELMEKQRAIKVQSDQLSMENQAIQDNAQVAKARQDLDTLKQNIGFLGQGGRPVQSQQVLDSYDRMLATSDQQFKDMVQIQNNMKQMRELWVEFDENAYNAQLDQIHTDLKRNVDSVIQQAINGFSADQMAWLIDSPESLQRLQDKYGSMIDQSVMWLTNKSIANLQTMQEVYKGKIETAQMEYKAYQESMAQYQKQQYEEEKTFRENELKVSPELSKANNIYVNGNGKPILRLDGTTIPYQEWLPQPTVDYATGNAIVWQRDANGNVTPTIEKVMEPSAAAKMDLLLKQAQLDKLKKESSFSDKTVTVKNADGSESVKQFNVKTGQYDIDITWTSPLSQDIQDPITMQNIADTCTTWRGSETVQCWMLVNDYLRQAMGKGKWSSIWDMNLWNMFTDKVKAIEAIGISPSPVEWWVFAFDVKTSQGNTGHTGIVTKVNEDGSIEVLEANRVEDSAKWWVPRTGTYTADQIGNMVFSIPPKWAEAQAQSLLSPQAKEALRSWTIIGTPTVQWDIVKELAKAWEFDKWAWNSTFFVAKPSEKTELQNLYAGLSSRDQAYWLYKKLANAGSISWKTGAFDSKTQKLGRFLGMWDEDTTNLNRILQKELSAYMMKISWATVPAEEVKRLAEQVPNLAMGDKEFVQAMEQYNTSMQRAKDFTLKNYWFNDENAMREKLYWSKKTTTVPTPSPQTTASQEWSVVAPPEIQSAFDTYFSN